jgi:hypothetical protein
MSPTSNPAEGFSERRDCTVRALTNVSGASYAEVHAVFAAHGRKNRRGIALRKVLQSVARDLGLTAQVVRRSGSVERLLRDFPAGRLVINTRGHAFAVIDGVVHDSIVTSPLCHVQRAWLVTRAGGAA